MSTLLLRSTPEKSPLQTVPGPSAPLAEHDLRVRIRRERARTDRNRAPFSLLVVELPECNGGQRSSAARVESEVRQALQCEMDVLDAWGWWGPGRLALLMPCTSSSAADQRAARVAQHLENKCLVVRWWRTTYPDDWVDPNHQGDGPDLADALFHDQPAWKRLIDVVGAMCGVIVLSPLLLGIALVVKATSRGPLFFRQQRVGAKGRLFWIWKFRTMRTDVDCSLHAAHIAQQMQSNGTMSKIDHVQPLIPLGAPLRKLGLDELPQLWNVLLGDMSLVGPRPDVAPWHSYSDWQRRRFDVLPGITGWWQVNGKNDTTFEEMMRMDAQYVDARSLHLDMKILATTIPALLKQCRQE